MIPLTTLVNLTLQLLLFVALGGATYLAKKKKFGRHCALIRIAVILQIIAVAAIMSPSLAFFLQEPSFNSLKMEVILHHTAGVVLILLWIYINLVSMKKLRAYLRLKTAMRLAFAVWVLALLLGLHVFAQIYL